MSNISLFPAPTGFEGLLVAETVNTETAQPTMVNGNPVSAITEFQSTVRAVLFPNMTTAQMVAIAIPSPGMVVYNTTASQLYLYTGTGGTSGWHAINIT